MPTLDEMRNDAISRLQHAFSKQRRLKKVAHSNGDTRLARELTEFFGGKPWHSFTTDGHLVYRMSESDYLWVMTDQAFL